MEKKYSRLSKVEKILNIDAIISIITFLALLLVTFFGVITRYFFNNPFIWQEEAQLMLIIWTVFFGASFVFREGGHIAIEMVVDMFPTNIGKIIEFIGYIIVVLSLIYLFIQGCELVKQMYVLDNYTSILKVPYEIVYLPFPTSCILMIISYSFEVYKEFVLKINKNQEGGV